MFAQTPVHRSNTSATKTLTSMSRHSHAKLSSPSPPPIKSHTEQSLHLQEHPSQLSKPKTSPDTKVKTNLEQARPGGALKLEGTGGLKSGSTDIFSFPQIKFKSTKPVSAFAISINPLAARAITQLIRASRKGQAGPNTGLLCPQAPPITTRARLPCRNDQFRSWSFSTRSKPVIANLCSLIVLQSQGSPP